MHAARSVAFLALCAALCACHDGTGSYAEMSRPELCDRPGDDRVRDVFCAEVPPAIGSLRDLLVLFRMEPNEIEQQPSVNIDTSSEIAALGHSTALSGRLVTPLNPRVIFIGSDLQLAFARGTQRVEISTRQRGTQDVVLYLVSFEQPCTEDECTPGDLYTSAIETDWTRLRLEDDEDLKNTPADCRQCHRRGRERTKLLMRELESPWTHFFFPVGTASAVPLENGGALMRDYEVAKRRERYAGVELSRLTGLGAFVLQGTVGDDQPLLFDAPRIQTERWPWSPETGYATEVHESPTWEGAYEAFKRGEQLALPYLELRATDPDKQAAAGAAYQRYLKGELARESLPDMSDIYPDDPKLRARIGLSTEADATPAEALIQACGPCHNDVLDQSLSRARFNIALGRLEREEIDTAIERIERSPEEPGAMPPPEARQLAPEARQRLLEYLKSELDPETIDPMLERAAELGMAGGAKPE